MAPHKFKAGETVSLSSRLSHASPAGRYQIVRLLPADSTDNQYRLKSALDGRERVVWENEIS